MPFKDSSGLIGRPTKAPDDQTSITAKHNSRSLNKLSLKIGFEFKNAQFTLDLSNVVDSKIRVKKADAVQLAKWILKVADRDRK